ncbi:hypothetical protein DUNSADRAFT_4902 [Dunaliella salina]|uniref:Uncharacterized protein n=1 Tax=Dunaliella salina TaxID=3046 RepID=A0ABQ7GR27_DUNSA|nr:hypothetical protein DUNSADRAFT_4902 [Dunaliella salina]|eukprot:KAF5837069.1 hypothetical protein DUNSADRAFT_4902 [Dunaliella salina]
MHAHTHALTQDASQMPSPSREQLERSCSHPHELKKEGQESFEARAPQPHSPMRVANAGSILQELQQQLQQQQQQPQQQQQQQQQQRKRRRLGSEEDYGDGPGRETVEEGGHGGMGQHVEDAQPSHAARELPLPAEPIGKPQAAKYRLQRKMNPPGYEILMFTPGFTLDQLSVKAFPEGRVRVVATPHDIAEADLWGVKPINVDVNLPHPIDPYGSQVCTETLLRLVL